MLYRSVGEKRCRDVFERRLGGEVLEKRGRVVLAKRWSESYLYKNAGEECW